MHVIFIYMYLFLHKLNKILYVLYKLLNTIDFSFFFVMWLLKSSSLIFFSIQTHWSSNIHLILLCNIPLENYIGRDKLRTLQLFGKYINYTCKLLFILQISNFQNIIGSSNISYFIH